MRICVAVALQRYHDFTPVALRQRELARVLAEADSAGIDVVTAEAPVALLPGLETTEEKLERYAALLREAGCEVRTRLREGRPSREIVRHLEETGADLLIMGTHSKRGPLDVGLGSTAAALPDDLEIPVLFVRPSAADQERTRELMIPRYPLVFPYG